MGQDETIRIRFETDFQAVEKSEFKVKQLRQELSGTKALMESGHFVGSSFEKGLKAMEADLARAEKEHAKLNATLARSRSAYDQAGGDVDKLDKQLRKAGESGGGAARFAAGMAYMADDLQYVGTMGIRPVMNNVTQLLVQMGAAGSAVAFVGTVAYAAAQNWRPLAAAIHPGMIAQGASEMETLGKRVEELGRHTHLTASEMRELAAAKSAVSAIKFEDEQAGKPGRNVAGMKAAFDDAVTGGDVNGFGAIQSAVNEAFVSEFNNGDNRPKMIAEAAASGMLKDANGNAAGFNADQFKNDGEYARKKADEFTASVQPMLIKQWMEELGKGDAGAAGRLRQDLTARGFRFEADGSVLDANGKKNGALSRLYAGTPEARERADAMERGKAAESEATDLLRSKAKERADAMMNHLAPFMVDGSQKPGGLTRNAARDFIRQRYEGSTGKRIGNSEVDLIIDEAMKRLREEASKQSMQFGGNQGASWGALGDKYKRERDAPKVAEARRKAEKTAKEVEDDNRLRDQRTKAQAEALGGGEMEARATALIHQSQGSTFFNKREQDQARDQLIRTIQTAVYNDLRRRGYVRERAEAFAREAPAYYGDLAVEQRSMAYSEAGAFDDIDPPLKDSTRNREDVRPLRRNEASMKRAANPFAPKNGGFNSVPPTPPPAGPAGAFRSIPPTPPEGDAATAAQVAKMSDDTLQGLGRFGGTMAGITDVVDRHEAAIRHLIENANRVGARLYSNRRPILPQSPR